MAKAKIATTSLAGCFGCHMSLLDIDERILELVELVESTAPALWLIAHQQVKVDAIEDFFWAVFFGVSMVVCWKVAHRLWAKLETCEPYDGDFYTVSTVALRVTAIVALPIALTFLIEATKRFVSPDYYALKLLITMATGGD